MKGIPHYTKILTLGSAYTENALVGDVIIQEKIDGSQFRWGINDEGNLLIGSKNVIIHSPEENKMFAEGVRYVISIQEKLKKYKNTFFYGEYLQKPKHNVLKYDRIPKNHIILFDVLCNGKWLDRKELVEIAKYLDIDIIPELYKGRVDIESLKKLLNTPSYLGNEIVEGIVIKNYHQTILLGGKVFPLFTKYVREQFKERHTTEWKIKHPKNTIQSYLQSFRNEARWQKAFQYLRDKDKIENNPKDIGALIKRVQEDIIEEETENIKKELYNKFIKDILKCAVKGLPEWYKQKLLNNLNPNKEEK